MITLEEAADIVLELAQQNVLDDELVMNEPHLQEVQDRQQEAVNVVHDHFVNTVWDGTDEEG